MEEFEEAKYPINITFVDSENKEDLESTLKEKVQEALNGKFTGVFEKTNFGKGDFNE